MQHFWATFFSSKLITFSTKINSFKTWSVVSILRFQRWFDVDVLGFQIQICYRYFGLFCLENVWATFKIWAIF
jgi:hypothetical protein